MYVCMYIYIYIYIYMYIYIFGCLCFVRVVKLCSEFLVFANRCGAFLGLTFGTGMGGEQVTPQIVPFYVSVLAVVTNKFETPTSPNNT